MTTSEKTGRDLQALRQSLEEWMKGEFSLNEHPKIVSLETVATGGLSNETLLLEAEMPDGNVEGFVLRAPPPDEGIFPTSIYDMKLQGEFQSRLAKAGIPTPATIAYEGDARWIGCEFLLMPMLEGRAPADFPCYIDEGWLKELSPTDQYRSVQRFLYWMGQMHQLDIEEWGLTIAARNTPGATPLAQEFQWWKDYLDWISTDDVRDEVQKVSEVVEWCERNWPDQEPAPSFVWGDARPANVLFNDDLEVMGFLDFELAGLAPAEFDLGTWLTYRRNLMASRDGDLPELPGYPDRQETIDMFESCLARKVVDVAWHELFAAMRQGSCIIGIKSMWRRRGMGEVPIPSVVPEWQVEAMKSN